MIRIKSDKIIVGGGLFDGYVYVKDGKIVEVSADEKPADTAYDYTGSYLSAGFIDLHTHGAGAHPFINGTVEDVIEGSNFHLAHGTTTILPTISAGPFENMKKAVENIHLARKDKRAKGNIYGAHLEGPYLSAAQCGAQCPTFITPPNKADYEALIEEYGESVARWTYAPENDADGEFCRYLSQRGILVSIGHSNAKYPDVKVLILTTFDDSDYILNAINNGANGYLLKDISTAALIDAVKNAYAGDTILPAKIARSIAQAAKNVSADREIKLSRAFSLSDREVEIAIMMFEGFTNRQISSALKLSEGTTRNYVSAIYLKTGSENRAEAIAAIKAVL